MKKNKPTITRDAASLAKTLGLSASHGYRWELRSDLVSSIIQAISQSGLTHAIVAKRAGTSRTRVTSIVNRNIDDVSTDLLLRILETLGYRVRFSVSKVKLAA